MTTQNLRTKHQKNTTSYYCRHRDTTITECRGPIHHTRGVVTPTRTPSTSPQAPPPPRARRPITPEATPTPRDPRPEPTSGHRAKHTTTSPPPHDHRRRLPDARATANMLPVPPMAGIPLATPSGMLSMRQLANQPGQRPDADRQCPHHSDPPPPAPRARPRRRPRLPLGPPRSSIGRGTRFRLDIP